MKRLLIITTFLSLCIFSWSQEKKAKVVMKNNASITGVIKEFNPASHIVISVAGFETRIEMSDVLEVKPLDKTDGDVIKGNESVKRYEIPREILEKENKDYPEEYVLEYKDIQIPMVLIRGGVFDMGYNGPGSLKMKSEPIHKVFVSSFYISKRSLTKGMVSVIRGKRTSKSTEEKVYSSSRWSSANSIVELLAKGVSIPLRLPTEAEWEYVVSTAEYQGLLSFEKDEENFCNDYWDSYPKNDQLYINPTGPKDGSAHVSRTFGSSPSIYCSRSKVKDYSTETGGACIRIVVPADSLPL